MFNFFKKKENNLSQDPTENTVDEDEAVASVTYYIKKNLDEARVSVNIEDFSEQSILGLSKVISVLSKKELQLETMNIIKEFFIENERPDIFIALVSQIVLSSDNAKDNSDTPCIKPSELA